MDQRRKHAVPRGQASHKWKGGVIRQNGVLYRYMPGHSRAQRGGYVAEHYLVIEKKLGRHLTSDEIVVFNDGDRTNLNESNLIALTNRNELGKYIARKRGFSLKIEVKCTICDSPVLRSKSNISKTGNIYCSPECSLRREPHLASEASKKKFLYAGNRPRFKSSRQAVKVPRNALFCATCGTCAEHLEKKPPGMYCRTCDTLVDLIQYAKAPVVVGMRIKKHVATCRKEEL